MNVNPNPVIDVDHHRQNVDVGKATANVPTRGEALHVRRPGEVTNVRILQNVPPRLVVQVVVPVQAAAQAQVLGSQ